MAAVLTWALQALVEQPVQEGPAVVAEGGGGVGVDLELVPASLRLELPETRN